MYKMDLSMKIKEENTSDSDYCEIIEDDIKIEETRIQGYNEDNQIDLFPWQNMIKGVVIEQKLSVCSMCRNTYQRKNIIKVQNVCDLNKCNTCILHSRLSEVFKTNPLRVKRKKKHSGGCHNTEKCKKRLEKAKNKNKISNPDANVITVEDSDSDSSQSDSVLIKKVMFLCLTCRKPFERSQPIKFQSKSDQYKCNKCILHSRLDAVFSHQAKKTRTKC